MSHNPLDREEMESVLAARQEMGPSMEPALVDSFAEKILAEVRRQTQQDNAIQQGRRAPRGVARNRDHQGDGSGSQLALGIVSLALAIPLTAIASAAGTFMMILVWVGIVAINLAFAWSRRQD